MLRREDPAGDKPTEATFIDESVESRTERDSSSAMPVSVYKGEASVDKVQKWADKRDELDQRCESSVAYDLPITQDIVSTDFFKTTELMS